MNVNNKNSTTHLPDDAPELDDDFFSRADVYQGDKLIRKGRPMSLQPKQSTTIRLDADVLAAFKASGKGWQTRINDALKEWLTMHQKI